MQVHTKRTAAETLRRRVLSAIVATCAWFVLLLGVGAWIAPAPRTPRDVAKDYCRMDGEGQQLTVEGWQAMAALFVTPGARVDPQMMTVVRRCSVSPFDMQGADKATLFIESPVLGTLDRTTVRFTRTPVPGGMAPVRWLFTLTRTRAGWKIAGPLYLAPHVTVDTAIRIVTQTRDTTRDAAVKAEAERSLASLRGLLLR